MNQYPRMCINGHLASDEEACRVCGDGVPLRADMALLLSMISVETQRPQRLADAAMYLRLLTVDPELAAEWKRLYDEGWYYA